MNPQDERMAIMERIIEKNRIADEKYEKEMAENAEAAEIEGYDREMEKENAEYEREQENEANQVTPEEALSMFTAPADEGGFGDLLENPDKRQKIIDQLDLAVASGAADNDYRTYQRVGNQFREREKKLKAGELDPNAVSREDVMNQLAAQRHRQMLLDNQYVNAGQEEPEGPEQIRERFAMDNPDFDGETLRGAAKAVDDTHKKQFVQRGYASNEYEVYRKAGEAAERQRYLRERQGE